MGPRSVTSILAFIAVLACAAGAQASGRDRNVIAVIVDDSGSMADEDGAKTGSDPRGLAAFAATQMARFAAEGSTLGIFTYSSARHNGGKPMYVVRGVNDRKRASSMEEIRTSLLEKNAQRTWSGYEGAHPYWFRGTPCLETIETAGAWLKQELDGRDPGFGSVLFLTDGECNGARDRALRDKPQRAASEVTEYLGSSGLYCVAFGDGARLPQLKPICRAVETASTGEGALTVLKAFMTNLDQAAGGLKVSRIFSSGGEEKLPPYPQSVGVNLIVTEECADKCDPFSDLPEDLKAKFADRVHRDTWRWPTAHKDPGKLHYRVHGLCEKTGAECDFRDKPCAGDERCIRNDEARFETAYVRLTWEEMEAAKGHLNTKKEGRSAIIRPEYWIRPVMQVYEGQCSDLPTASARLKRVETQRSKLQDVCVEVTLAAAGPDDQRLCYEQGRDGNPVAYQCDTGQTCYNNYCSALATWDTVHVVYAEGTEGGRFPNELPADVKTSFGTCAYETKASPAKPPTLTVTDDAFHGDPAERDMPTGPVWRHDRHLPLGYRVAAGWTTEGWNQFYFHMLPVDAQAGVLCTNEGARVPPGRMTGQIAEMRHSDDLDDDQERSLTDCDDQDPTRHHNHEELCDSKDNDCDGKIDEGLENFATDERVKAGMAKYSDTDCDGTRGEKTLPVSKRGQVNDVDFDNDGCNNAYEPGNERNAKIAGDARGICRQDCVWDLAGSETLTRKSADDDWYLEFGDPMKAQAVRRTLNSDPNSTRLNCITTSDQPDFNLRLRPRDEAASFDDACFSLTGVGIGPDGPDTPGWTVLPNNPTEMDITLERKHICGNLGPPGGEDSMKIYGADGLWALLEVDFDKSAGLEPGKMLPRSRPVKLNAAFEQSLEIQVSGRVQPYADKAEDQLLKVSITPHVPKKVQVKVSLDKLKGHVSAEMLKGELSILRDDQFCEGTDEDEECEPSKLYWVECTDPYKILQDSGEKAASLTMWGQETRELCLQYRNPLHCAQGGLLFQYCACTEDARHDGGWASFFCDSTPFKEVERERKGKGYSEPYVAFRDAEVTIGEQKPSYTVVEQRPTAPYTVSRDLWDWLLPPGPGWWWAVILLHLFIVVGAVYSYNHSLWPMSHPSNSYPVVGWLFAVWAVALFTQLTFG